MALGYCESLLLHLKQISGDNYPGTKITPPGFLQMLTEDPDRPRSIGEAFQNGHRKSVRIKYKTRSVEGQVQTSASCDLSLTNIYAETTADVDKHVRIGIYFPEDEIRKYCEDASRMQSEGAPPTRMMNEHIDGIMHGLNGPLAKMNSTLLTLQASAFGANANNSFLTTARTLNISKDVQVQALDAGMNELFADVEDHELIGTPRVVGTGLFRNFWRSLKFKSADMAGINPAGFQSELKFFNDRKVATAWGTNHIGVFAPNSVHLIDYVQNTGSFAGDKGNGTWFFTITDPITGLKWDAMWKYYDCPTVVTNAYTGLTQTIQRGWVLVLSKDYGYFTTPTGAFDGADVLHGSNGTLRYNVTNSCDTCS
jgi:hypothetical protein